MKALLLVVALTAIAAQAPRDHTVEPPPGYHCSMTPIAGEAFHACHCHAMADPATACETPIETQDCDTYCWMTHHCRCARDPANCDQPKGPA